MCMHPVQLLFEDNRQFSSENQASKVFRSQYSEFGNYKII